jgi:hypothetical protein
LEVLQRPERLWSRAEVLTRPTPVPPVAGIYGWHFATAPDPTLDANRLLYVGIAPRHMRPRASRQSLRTRIRYHFRGNAAGSTLRLTLGCLLGLELRGVGSGARMTFGRDGEAALNAWLEDNAWVCWFPCDQPWLVEAAVIGRADLPLNLDQNRAHPFHARLTEARSAARRRARELPVIS